MSHRVIGGKEAIRGAWPWIVSIRIDGGSHLDTGRWQHNCGGKKAKKSLCGWKNMIFAWWYWFIHPAQCPIIAVLDASVISLPDSSVVHNGPQLIICEVSSMIMNHVNDPPPLPLSIKFIPAGAGSHDSWAQSRKHSKSEKMARKLK